MNNNGINARSKNIYPLIIQLLEILHSDITKKSAEYKIKITLKFSLFIFETTKLIRDL